MFSKEIKRELKARIDLVKSVQFRTEFFPWTLGVLCFISLASFAGLVAPKGEVKNIAEVPRSNPFRSVSISAESALVWDVYYDKDLYKKKADEPRPLASLTKVMTAITARKITSKNKEISIHEADIQTFGDSKLVADSKWNLDSIIDYSLLVSSNDGASAIASALGSFLETIPSKNNTSNDADVDKNPKDLFIKEMNKDAVEIGLLNSKFVNESGLDQSIDKVGAYGSARDMARLFEYAMKNYPDLLEATRYNKLLITDKGGIIYNAENTNTAADLIPSLIASKTGYTDLAGGNLVVAFDAGVGRPIIVSVLGSTQEGRFEDVLKLVDASIKYLQNK